MKMDKVANSKNDEFYTPLYAVLPIISFVKDKNYNKVWCPFDTKNSFFVKELSKHFDVHFTHIDNGQDFFNEKTPDCDIIISNPPYSLKTEILQNLFDRKKPFAMLVGVAGLFESKHRVDMFSKNEFEVLYLDKRVSYFKNFDDIKPELNPPFQSVYITSGLLPQKIMFTEINKKLLTPQKE